MTSFADFWLRHNKQRGQRYVMVIELWEGEKGTDGYRIGGYGHLLPSFGSINI